MQLYFLFHMNQLQSFIVGTAKETELIWSLLNSFLCPPPNSLPLCSPPSPKHFNCTPQAIWSLVKSLWKDQPLSSSFVWVCVWVSACVLLWRLHCKPVHVGPSVCGFRGDNPWIEKPLGSIRQVRLGHDPLICACFCVGGSSQRVACIRSWPSLKRRVDVFRRWKGYIAANSVNHASPVLCSPHTISFGGPQQMAETERLRVNVCDAQTRHPPPRVYCKSACHRPAVSC